MKVWLFLVSPRTVFSLFSLTWIIFHFDRLLGELGPKVTEGSLVLMPVLLSFLKHEATIVVRQSVVCGTRFFCSVLEEIAQQVVFVKQLFKIWKQKLSYFCTCNLTLCFTVESSVVSTPIYNIFLCYANVACFTICIRTPLEARQKFHQCIYHLERSLVEHHVMIFIFELYIIPVNDVSDVSGITDNKRKVYIFRGKRMLDGLSTLKYKFTRWLQVGSRLHIRSHSTIMRNL